MNVLQGLEPLLEVLRINTNRVGSLLSGSSLVQWKVSERDGSHTGERVLYWALVEQARHEHVLDKYKNQHIIVIVPWSPFWARSTLDTTMVPLQN